VTGLWLIVDALAILGVAGGIASWFLTSNRQTWIIAESVAAALCAMAALLAVYIRRRAKQPFRDAVPATRDGAPSTPLRGKGTSSARTLRLEGELIENLRALHKMIARTCCQHSDGSGKVHGEVSRAFFAQLEVASVAPLLVESELRGANEFQRLLDRIAHGIGEPPAPELDHLRLAIHQIMEPTLARMAESLAAAEDLQAFRDILVDCCFEHSDGRGWVTAWGLNSVLSQVTAAKLAALFEPARPKALSGLARIVGLLSRHLSSPCAKLEVVRAALIDAGRARLPASRQVDWLVPFIAGLCCERADGGGKVDREAARRLFEGLSIGRMGDRLSHVPIRELNDIAQALSRIAPGLEEPQPAGFRGLMKAIDESIELAALHSQPALLEADNLATVRRVLVETCCECDDGSGFSNRRALHAIFEGVEAERFCPQIEAATPGERLQLSQLVNRIDLDRRGETVSSAVSRFRELLATAVERDRAQPRGDGPERPAESHVEGEPAHEAAESDGGTLTWQVFKHADLTNCSPAHAQQFARLLDDIAQDGEEGLRRIVRRLWNGLRRDGDRLMVDLPPEDLAHEWARKRFLAEALARGADRRTVPKLITLLEGDCDDPEYRNSVQPAIAEALAAMSDKRAVEALRRVQPSPHISSATRRVIATSKRVSRYGGETPK